jgi:DnaJ-class molecular chaperone with C-terminal Zn finger domain
MSDPYTTLGISPDASDDEVKRAYRELAKKYHPDSYVNNPLSHLAEEKMKEINEAYDTVVKQRQSGGGYTAPGSPYESGGGRSILARAREQIAKGEYSGAELLIDSVQSSGRNAEWNYLKGIVLIHRGWYIDAQSYLANACKMDPFNTEYRDALNQLQNRTGGAGGGSMNNPGCSGCDMCTSLICADCLCECCGGDLIGCC